MSGVTEEDINTIISFLEQIADAISELNGYAADILDKISKS